jgi:formylglycine-generating enzyme required for sulfatase activity
VNPELREYALESGLDKYPRVHVSFADAQAYCRWLSAKSGSTFRLPWETEWQYAALGPRKQKWSLGNTFVRQEYHCNDEGPTFGDVGRESDFGFLHLTGNVFEWCADEYRPTLSSDSAGNALKGMRVIKGGAFILRESRGLRNSARFSCAEDSCLNCVGFRVVCEQ